MTIIFIIMAVMFVILLTWSWHSLGKIENKTKITTIIVGILIVYIITWIVFTISKAGIVYENDEGINLIRTVFVLLFTIVNGYIVLPYIFRKLEQIDREEIKKEKLKKSIFIISIVTIVLVVLEIGYFKNVQNGILSMGK